MQRKRIQPFEGIEVSELNPRIQEQTVKTTQQTKKPIDLTKRNIKILQMPAQLHNKDASIMYNSPQTSAIKVNPTRHLIKIPLSHLT